MHLPYWQFIPPALFYFQIVYLFGIFDVTFDSCERTDERFNGSMQIQFASDRTIATLQRPFCWL